jgi:hypothetical protein
MKKTLLAILALSALSVTAAPALKKDWGVFGNWRSAEILGHAFSGKNACMAYTQTTDAKSTLELYAQESTNAADGYIEPTFQVVPDARIPRFIRGIAKDAKKLGEFHLTLQTTRATPPAYALLVREQDRVKFLDVLKKSSKIDIQLVGEKNKLVKTLTFSLKGSTKAIDAVINGCGLAIEQ